ncbi:hypothetical protein [Escherichia coli]|uniref:hypothetical protein n=1 Tax=Escherichia coli TaxID=562 RepID=UPI003DA74E60
MLVTVPASSKSVSKAVTSNETKIKGAFIALFTFDRGITEKTPERGRRGDDAAQEGRVKAGRNTGMMLQDGPFPVYLQQVAGRATCGMWRG